MVPPDFGLKLDVRHRLEIEGQGETRPAWQILLVIVAVLVVGLAALMQGMGVSMALGAFMGGVLLATS